MSLQDLGNLGELVAAIATVATLVYLVIQVRDNSRAVGRANEFAQARSIHQVTSLFNELNWRLASSGELADIYARALAGEDLTPSELASMGVRISLFASIQRSSASAPPLVCAPSR